MDDKDNTYLRNVDLDEIATTYIAHAVHFSQKGKRLEKARLPDGHALRFKMMPSLIHLVQSTLKHNRVILTRQRAQQLAPRAVQRGVHVPVRFDFRLEILQR